MFVNFLGNGFQGHFGAVHLTIMQKVNMEIHIFYDLVISYQLKYILIQNQGEKFCSLARAIKEISQRVLYLNCTSCYF